MTVLSVMVSDDKEVSGLFGRACTSDLAHLVHEASDKILFLRLRLLELLTVYAFYLYDVDSADHGTDLLLHWNIIINLVICYEIHDLRADLRLDNRKLGAAQILRCGVNNCLRKTRFLQAHFLLVDDQHGDGLLGRLNGFLLLLLLLLHLLAEKVKPDCGGNQNSNNY